MYLPFPVAAISTVLALLCLIGIETLPLPDRTDSSFVSRFLLTVSEELTVKTSEKCKSQNGFCVRRGECPSEKLASPSQGLCDDAETECCHSLPSSVTECEERGGFCGTASECGRAPREPQGVCPKGHFCCVRIR